MALDDPEGWEIYHRVKATAREHPDIRIFTNLIQRGGRMTASGRTLILADVSRKALWQVERFVSKLLKQHMKSAQAAEVARVLSSGIWIHDYPLEPEELEALGLLVKVGIPRGVHELMRLYPQPRGRQESVECVPSPPRPRERPPGRSEK
jgi:hypothetical protein